MQIQDSYRLIAAALQPTADYTSTGGDGIKLQELLR
jgi:hypothetical protein